MSVECNLLVAMTASWGNRQRESCQEKGTKTARVN